MLKRATLIGIDEYQHVTPLAGCVNDVMSLLPLLERNDDHDAVLVAQDGRAPELGVALSHILALASQGLI